MMAITPSLNASKRDFVSSIREILPESWAQAIPGGVPVPVRPAFGPLQDQPLPIPGEVDPEDRVGVSLHRLVIEAVGRPPLFVPLAGDPHQRPGADVVAGVRPLRPGAARPHTDRPDQPPPGAR